MGNFFFSQKFSLNIVRINQIENLQINLQLKTYKMFNLYS